MIEGTKPWSTGEMSTFTQIMVQFLSEGKGINDAFEHVLKQLPRRTENGVRRFYYKNIKAKVDKQLAAMGKGKTVSYNAKYTIPVKATTLKGEQQQVAVIPKPQAPQDTVTLINYPSVNGNVAQLRKRIEAILMLVELDGEDAELVLSIAIGRK